MTRLCGDREKQQRWFLKGRIALCVWVVLIEIDIVAGCIMDETEKNKLIDNYSHVWTYESIAWYAYE